MNFTDPHSQHPAEQNDASSLAHMLEPVLHRQCEGRLGTVTWFKSAWSSSGSATGSATWTDARGSCEVIVKLPMGPAEFRWTTELGNPQAKAPTPRVFASGSELNGYDLAWIVEERVKGEPIRPRMQDGDVRRVLIAASDFHDAALRVRPEIHAPKHLDWEGTLAKARDVCHAYAIAEPQRWNEAIKQVVKLLPKLLARWTARPLNCWCHGDLHPGNVLRLESPRDDSHACVMIDLAMVHPGHWVEDAVYLERQYWAAPEYLHGVKPVTELANLRRERGMRVDPEYPDLANIRRVLMAAVSPAFTDREGHPKYLRAALETLENTLPQVSR
ncbi:MAG: aminoglycoside phosphotransferase family protein [Phycisphaeraceae bacterium]|nr:aminoglycoside phosphotransferase family protein [Phycisphaeraceae bacterium]